jgi:hypothetical protein
MTIEEFKTPVQVKPDKGNRWIRLGDSLPWDALASIYYRTISSDMGVPAIDARVVIGAMIIKHKLKMDDKETIETIRENMYIQYFLGLMEYTYQDVFDRSLFTTLRYRLGADKFDAMTRQIILRSEGKEDAAKKDLYDHSNEITTSKLDRGGDDISLPPKQGSTEIGSKATVTEQKPKENKGILIVDATVANQMIAYPTDLGLLSKSREESERLIDELCKVLVIND